MEYATVKGGDLNMRSDSDTHASRVTLIPNGSRVEVIEKGSVWCKAAYKSYKGYVMIKYLQFSKENDDTIVVSRSKLRQVYSLIKELLNES